MTRTRTTSVPSPREHEVLVLRARGFGIREIARRLSIKPTTVDGYLQRIANKIGARHAGVLAHYAHSHGMLE